MITQHSTGLALTLRRGTSCAVVCSSASSLLRSLTQEVGDLVRRSLILAIYDWFEAAHPGDRTGPNPTTTAAATPVAPRCDVTASNSTQKEPGQPARFSFCSLVGGSAGEFGFEEDVGLFF